MHHSNTKLTENERRMKLNGTSLSWKSKFKKQGRMKNKMILVPVFVNVWIMPEVLHGMCICVFTFSVLPINLIQILIIYTLNTVCNIFHLVLSKFM
jgi:hypothetical protein